jgi:hypothetical protein
MLDTIRRNPAVEEAPLQSELMLFDPATSRFFVLNRTMAYVWKRCDSDATLDALVGALGEEFDGVDADAARGDVERALDELISAGLVTRTGEPLVNS